VLCSLNRYREALIACDRAIRLDPDLARAYNNKSVALCGLKRYGEAVGVSEQAILIDPNLAVAYHNKGVALQGLGRANEAHQSIERARQLGYRGQEEPRKSNRWVKNKMIRNKV
jgi:tetratricopeptide (TPR) repeat protein